MDSVNPARDAPLPESRFSIVLVEPLYPDNIGHVARSMLNFGVGDLVLVRARRITKQARDRAVHAQSVLDGARRFDSMEEVAREFEHVVAFAARVSTLDKAHLRYSVPLEETARKVGGRAGRVALVFGREDTGLANEDIEPCDLLSTIPTSPHYRSMNLSHAVTVALYEMTRGSTPALPEVTMATPREKQVLFATWWHLTGALGFKPHRRRHVMQVLQRIVGRAGLTSWEYHRVMGVLSRSLKRLDAWPPPRPEDSDAPTFDADIAALDAPDDA